VPDPIIGILRAFGVDLDRDGVAVQVGPERGRVAVDQRHVLEVTSRPKRGRLSREFSRRSGDSAPNPG